MVNAIVRVREAIGDPILGFGTSIRRGSVALYTTFFIHLSNYFILVGGVLRFYLLQFSS